MENTWKPIWYINFLKLVLDPLFFLISWIISRHISLSCQNISSLMNKRKLVRKLINNSKSTQLLRTCSTLSTTNFIVKICLIQVVLGYVQLTTFFWMFLEDQYCPTTVQSVVGGRYLSLKVHLPLSIFVIVTNFSSSCHMCNV